MAAQEEEAGMSAEPTEALCAAEVWHCIKRGEKPLGGALWLPFLLDAPHES